MPTPIARLVRGSVVHQILDDFEKTYKDVIDTLGVADNQIAKAGFYASVLRMVRENPLPWLDIQTELLRRLGDIQDEQLDSFHDVLERTFELLSTERMGTVMKPFRSPREE